jgi:hypothetical protein
MGDINMDNQQAPPQQPIQQPLPTAEQLHEFITRQVRLQLGQQHHNHNNNISITNRPKPAKPPMYDGKLGTDPTVWLFQVKQYFDITNTPEATRPMIASTYLTDNAATWWQTFTSIQPNGDARAITWQMFHTGLTGMFKPVNSKKVARDRLAALQQTHSVVKYNFDFQQLCLQIDDINEAEKLDKYVRGLKQHIRVKVELEQATTLTQAMSHAHVIDSITYHNRVNAYNNPTSGIHINNNDAMDLSTIQGEHDNNIDDTLNAVTTRNNYTRGTTYNNNSNQTARRTFTPLQRLSQDEFAYCQRNRLCLRCKEPGHIARNCSKEVKPLNLKAR